MKRVILNINEQMYSEIKEIADSIGNSVSSMVIFALSEYIENKKKKTRRISAEIIINE